MRAAPGIGSVDRRASLERRALGVTTESVIADIQRVAALPQPTNREWVWHDAAYLELHPEEARPIVAGMADQSVTVGALRAPRPAAR